MANHNDDLPVCDELETVCHEAAERGFYEPINERAKQYIIKAIRENAERIRKAGWPGLPVVWLPLSVAHNVNALIAEGAIRQVAVTKLSIADPGRVVTYTYLVVETDQQLTAGQYRRRADSGSMIEQSPDREGGDQ